MQQSSSGWSNSVYWSEMMPSVFTFAVTCAATLFYGWNCTKDGTLRTQYNMYCTANYNRKSGHYVSQCVQENKRCDFQQYSVPLFQQIIGIPMGTNSAPLLTDIFLYSYEVEFIQSTSLLSASKKRLSSQFNFTYGYIDDVLSINNLDFENYLGQMYPPELEINSRRRVTLLLPTWVCSCQSIGTVNFALPFTKNATIWISILQTFRSWVATSHLRPPMAFLSHNSSDTPELVFLMNVLFWGRCDFPISFSGRDMSRNVWNRL